MASKNTLWSVLKIPPPGHLPSPGPGSGPAQGDSSRVDTARGGGRVPPTQAPNAEGYGGGADVSEIASQLTADEQARNLAERMAKRAQRTPPGPFRPEANEVFDGMRSKEAWRHLIVATAGGTFTPASGSNTAAIALTYDQPTSTFNGGLLRLDQFPRGTHAMPVVNTFTWGSVGSTGTGLIEFFYQAQFGSVPIPLGVFNLAVQSYYLEPELVVDAPLTDPGSLNAGQLIYTTYTAGGTLTAIRFRLGFGFGYIWPQPAFRGYAEVEPRMLRTDHRGVQRREG